MPYDVNEVAEKVLNGISQARNDYRRWSQGEDLNRAPEYVITTSIARAVSRLDDARVTVETRVQYDIVDIVLWMNKREKVIIEIKKTANRYNYILNDLRKVCRILRNERSLQFGLVAYYISDSGRIDTERNVEQNVNEITLRGRAIANENNLSLRSWNINIRRCRSNSGLFWSAATLAVSRRPRRDSS